MLLIDKILRNPDNLKVFEFLKLDPNGEISLKNGDTISGYDEGGVVFFYDYARTLPDETRQIISNVNNILVNEVTGQIFAFHTGRFTFVFRCHFEKNAIECPDQVQMMQTLDGWTDIRQLGKEWALLLYFCDEEQEQIEWAYELSKRVMGKICK